MEIKRGTPNESSDAPVAHVGSPPAVRRRSNLSTSGSASDGHPGKLHSRALTSEGFPVPASPENKHLHMRRTTDFTDSLSAKDPCEAQGRLVFITTVSKIQQEGRGTSPRSSRTAFLTGHRAPSCLQYMSLTSVTLSQDAFNYLKVCNITEILQIKGAC